MGWEFVLFNDSLKDILRIKSLFHYNTKSFSWQKINESIHLTRDINVNCFEHFTGI